MRTWLADRKDAYTRPVCAGVYFIQGVDGGLIKIGISGDIESRLIALQHGSPVRLRVAAVIIDADWTVENDLHALFGHLRDRGEWFRPGPDLLKYIERLGGRASP